ncbi:MAG: exosome complex RNA-binding protein Csl4 [Thermoplasmata archaeon]|nr:exosome complex RNA-binding protein Csl4 [Thermoplasmata archaeon]
MSEPSDEKLVLPGDLLGTAEEFVPGHGTYEDKGKIYAALFGLRRFDARDRAIRVDAIHAIPQVNDDDLVYARVEEVKSAMVIVNVLSLASGKRSVPGNPEGTVHISKAKDGYTDSLSTEFQPGDVLVARVLQSQPTIKLSTAEANLGVVSARCQVCHAILSAGARGLVCPRCGNVEQRKVAKGHSSVSITQPRSDGRSAG